MHDFPSFSLHNLKPKNFKTEFCSSTMWKDWVERKSERRLLFFFTLSSPLEVPRHGRELAEMETVNETDPLSQIICYGIFFLSFFCFHNKKHLSLKNMIFKRIFPPNFARPDAADELEKI